MKEIRDIIIALAVLVLIPVLWLAGDDPNFLYKIWPRPAIVVAFVPVNWQGTDADFSDAAARHVQQFARVSGIERYLAVEIVIVDRLDGQPLDEWALTASIQAHVDAAGITADRIVGMTDGDLHPGGEALIVGWTDTKTVLVVESTNTLALAHEIAHTFGLCDEYSYEAWARQNRQTEGGCANPYPDDCPRDENAGPTCPGTPAANGAHSIMGLANQPGHYAFNEASLEGLARAFQQIAKEKEMP